MLPYQLTAVTLSIASKPSTKKTQKKDHARKQKRSFLQGRLKTARAATPQIPRGSILESNHGLGKSQEQLTGATVSTKMRSEDRQVREKSIISADSESAKLQEDELFTVMDFLRIGASVSHRPSSSNASSKAPSKALKPHQRPVTKGSISHPITEHNTPDSNVLVSSTSLTPSTPTTTTTNLSYDVEPPSPSSVCTADLVDDERTERWLAQGLPGPVRDAEEAFRRRSMNRQRIQASRRSVSPPSLPPPPLKHCRLPAVMPYANIPQLASPLNNGRDVYGNFICSPVLEYPPARPVRQASCQSLEKEEKEPPQLSLRGGGWELSWDRGKSRKTTQKQDSETAAMPTHADGAPHDSPSRLQAGRDIVSSTALYTEHGAKDMVMVHAICPQPLNIDRSPPCTQSTLRFPGHTAYPLQSKDSGASLPPSARAHSHDSHKRIARIWDEDLTLDLVEPLDDGQQYQSTSFSDRSLGNQTDDNTIISEYAVSEFRSIPRPLNEQIESSGPYRDYQGRLSGQRQLERAVHKHLQEELQWREDEPGRLKSLRTRKNTYPGTDTVSAQDSVNMNNSVYSQSALQKSV
ncbi:hypothetical protein ACN47E_004696 [Coniothyrium glycines]